VGLQATYLRISNLVSAPTVRSQLQDFNPLTSGFTVFTPLIFSLINTVPDAHFRIQSADFRILNVFPPTPETEFKILPRCFRNFKLGFSPLSRLSSGFQPKDFNISVGSVLAHVRGPAAAFRILGRVSPRARN